MSRFDYADPGTDPDYCDGLQADDPIDETGPTDPPVLQDDDGIDPVGHALHTALTALDDLCVLIPKQRTFAAALRFQRQLAAVNKVAEAIHTESLAHLDRVE